MADNSAISAKSISLSWCFWMAPASIFSLLFAAGPSAIAWFISKTIVNAINSFFSYRAWPHVLQEISKRLIPAVANLYASTAIVFVKGLVWIVASLAHCKPTSVFRRKIAFGCVPIKRVGCASSAPAASACAVFNGLSSNVTLSSAITNASKYNAFMTSSGVINNSPFAKFLTNETNKVVGFIEVSHNSYYTTKIGNCHP